MPYSIYSKYIVNGEGQPVTGSTIKLVPQALTYPTGAISLVDDHLVHPGHYYTTSAPDGEYQLWINDVLYEEHIWHGENRITQISNKFSPDLTSFAGGINSTASGQNSFAFGGDATSGGINEASGLCSTTFGDSNLASGQFSFALGVSNISSGIASFALGLGSISSGNYSFAFGPGTISSGSSSIAIGNSSESHGDFSVAIGQGNYAIGAYSFSAGTSTFASGSASTAFGNSSYATGDTSFVCGDSTNAKGHCSFAGGSSSNTNADNCFSFGDSNNANGISSVTMGTNNSTYGISSVALNSGNNAIGDMSVALGNGTSANGVCSISKGDNSSTIMFGQETTSDGSNVGQSSTVDVSGEIGGSLINNTYKLQLNRTVNQTLTPTDIPLQGGKTYLFEALISTFSIDPGTQYAYKLTWACTSSTILGSVITTPIYAPDNNHIPVISLAGNKLIITCPKKTTDIEGLKSYAHLTFTELTH
jgi:hypothetical protein